MATSTDVIRQKVKALIEIYVGGTSNAPHNGLEDKLIRLLRPASRQIDVYASAAKQRLRKKITSESSDSQVAQNNVIIFEKECLKVVAINPNMLNAFLMIIEPLSLHLATKTLFNKGIVNYMENNMKLDVPSLDVIVENKNFKLPEMGFQDKNDIYDHVHEETWISKETEMAVLHELLFIFQGLESKSIKYDLRSESYVIDPDLRLEAPVRDTILSLCEIGWLYQQISKYIKAVEGDSTKGLVVQAFCYSIQEELQDYFRLLAVIEQELLSVQHFELGLTLLKLKAWLHEPMIRMCLLSRLVYSGQPLIGGAFISKLHGYTKHGDNDTKLVVQRIMHCICAPLYQAMTRWIIYGELADAHQEFFIAKRSDKSQNTNIWHDLYYVRNRMVPTFLPVSLADKILVIGKSINFILSYRLSIGLDVSQGKSKSKIGLIGNNFKKTTRRADLKVGMQPPSVADALGYQATFAENMSPKNDLNKLETMKKNAQLWASTQNKLKSPSGQISRFFTDKVVAVNESHYDSLIDISTEMESSLHGLSYGNEDKLFNIVDQVLNSVDYKLLDMMITGFHLFEHLEGLKKFMLLGQGDFITCLMDSVGPELQKPASKLYRHNLTGILEGALRSSNAQYENPYIINRVLVRLLEAMPGDTGWEVFTLDYHIDAPLNAVIHTEAISKYRMAFHMLWKLKRVEWTLSSSWKQRMHISHTAFKGYGPSGRDPWRSEFPKLFKILHQCNLSKSKMTHFVHNLGAYLMFEVMESAWIKLKEGILTAKSLNEIISLHDNYLSDILFRGLLTSNHETLNMQIQLLLQAIFRFCLLESSLLNDANVAVSRKRILNEERDRGVHRKSAQGEGTSSDYSLLNDPLNSYDGVSEAMISKVHEAIVNYNYQFDILMKMLQAYDGASEIIKFLTFRLDYNNYHINLKNVH